MQHRRVAEKPRCLLRLSPATDQTAPFCLNPRSIVEFAEKPKGEALEKMRVDTTVLGALRTPRWACWACCHAVHCTAILGMVLPRAAAAALASGLCTCAMLSPHVCWPLPAAVAVWSHPISGPTSIPPLCPPPFLPTRPEPRGRQAAVVHRQHGHLRVQEGADAGPAGQGARAAPCCTMLWVLWSMWLLWPLQSLRRTRCCSCLRWVSPHVLVSPTLMPAAWPPQTPTLLTAAAATVAPHPLTPQNKASHDFGGEIIPMTAKDHKVRPVAQ